MNFMNVDDLTVFSIGVHSEHSLDSRWKDYEMRKGFTRKPQADAPGLRVIRPCGLTEPAQPALA
jgi:hypothetical protein